MDGDEHGGGPDETRRLVDVRDSVLFERKAGAVPWRARGPVRVRTVGGALGVTFPGSDKEYTYGRDRAFIDSHPIPVALRGQDLLLVRGQPCEADETTVREYTAPDGQRWRTVWARDGNQVSTVVAQADEIEVVVPVDGSTRCPLSYFLNVLGTLPPNDAMRWTYGGLTNVSRESALSFYLDGTNEPADPWNEPLLHPFRSNASQREAVTRCLGSRISVIDGPPGTGKTETILNIIANIVARDRGTVGIVSFTNAAVTNVEVKLQNAGFGDLVIQLGRAEKKRDWFAASLTAPPTAPLPEERRADVDEELRILTESVDRAQRAERELARRHVELTDLQLEARHFEEHLRRLGVPDLQGLPLLRRSSDRILDYLAQVTVDEGHRPGLLERVRRYFIYGSLRDAAPEDADFVLGLQRGFYRRAEAELRTAIAHLEAETDRSDLATMSARLQELSLSSFRTAVVERLLAAGDVPFGTDEKNYRQSSRFGPLMRHHPVVTSTCHSLRKSLPTGELLDYLIVDEASQVNLLEAVAAMSSCRNLIIVGDERQLPPICAESATSVAVPDPAYDYNGLSLLTSVAAVYGETLPRTPLIEHYRCHPDIIGFCNLAFYDGALIPFRRSVPGDRPRLWVHTTVEGNHARRLNGRLFNQREIDVVAEVIADLALDVAPEDVAVVTPFRVQADRAAQLGADLVGGADTVHKMQGGEQRAIFVSTVISENREGGFARKFADGAHLVNVAVSRAADYLVIVTNHDKVPRTRNLRNLIGYVEYHNPTTVDRVSTIVSVFDLLYRRYNARLESLAARLQDGPGSRAELIVLTILHEMLEDPRYSALAYRREVHLRSLVADDSVLDADLREFVRTTTAVDFLVLNKITREPLLAIEVDGFAYHANNPEQQVRDRKKDAVLDRIGLELRRLPTHETLEEGAIRQILEEALAKAEKAD